MSDILDEIEAAAQQLDDTAATAARTRLADALSRLADHLLEHLDVEERAVIPVLQTWEHWPPHDQRPAQQVDVGTLDTDDVVGEPGSSHPPASLHRQRMAPATRRQASG